MRLGHAIWRGLSRPRVALALGAYAKASATAYGGTINPALFGGIWFNTPQLAAENLSFDTSQLCCEVIH